MVRVDHLNLYNPSAKECHIDKRLQSFGGVLYTRCYSPGPDTPRSLACMQSGLYPYFNGCDTRIRWPKFFIKDNCSTIWDHAVEKGLTVNLCCNESEVTTGFFKYKESDQIHLFYKPEDFIKKGFFNDNSLSFYGIPDMHTAISDYKASEYAFRKGDEVVDKHFDIFLTENFLSQFDYTIVFSDHGFQLSDEQNRMKSTLDLLNDSRNQLLMLIHRKGDTSIVKDTRIASMIDLYSTIESLIGGEDYRQGYSLLNTPQRTITHVEDHQDFKVYPEIMIKQWRIISDSFDIKTDVNNTEVILGNEEDKKKAEQYLTEFSPRYIDYVKQLNVWRYYESLYLKGQECLYFNGLPREKKTILFLHKLYNKIKQVSTRLFDS